MRNQPKTGLTVPPQMTPMPSKEHPLQELHDELNLWEISAQLNAIKERLSLIKVECREIQALKTGITVAESALESLLQ